MLFLTLTLDYAHGRFLPYFSSFYFEASWNTDRRRVTTASSHCSGSAYVFVYGSLGLQGPCGQESCSLLLPWSLEQYLAHKGSTGICQNQSINQSRSGILIWWELRKCLAMNLKCFPVSINWNVTCSGISSQSMPES